MTGHPNPNLALVTLLCLVGAWGPVFAAIAYGVVSGLRAARTGGEIRGPKQFG
jgi:hypothetical protein